jgi:hypothetical protein
MKIQKNQSILKIENFEPALVAVLKNLLFSDNIESNFFLDI